MPEQSRPSARDLIDRVIEQALQSWLRDSEKTGDEHGAHKSDHDPAWNVPSFLMVESIDPSTEQMYKFGLRHCSFLRSVAPVGVFGCG